MSQHRDVDRLVAGVLASAAAPARAEEFAGEPAVMVAYRLAHLADSPVPRRESMIKLALAKLLTVKAAAAAAVAAATLAGGVALATTGNLPGPIGNLGVAGLGTAAAPTELPTPTDAAGADATPSPSLAGLCTAYLAGAGDNPGRALENPAFRVLVTEAGGEEEVDGFCTELVPSVAEQESPASPKGPPGGLPTVAPSIPEPPGLPAPPVQPPDGR
jgi:hypothetical protein